METYIRRIIFLTAISLSFFQLYTAAFGVFTAMIQRSIHLSMVLVLIFLLWPSGRQKGGVAKKVSLLDLSLVGLSLAMSIYMWVTFADLPFRIGNASTSDLIFGIIALGVVIEATRRVTGWGMPIIACIFLLYPFVGKYLPGAFGHSGYSLRRLISQVYLTTDGIYGAPLGIVATFVAMFILFGAFLQETGGGKVFVDFAFALAGKRRGGPAKVAVLSSGLMGMISGSPVANVATTGTFTIPLMKQLGYKPHVAGAIEAAASTGGSIMPPIMGAGAFVMSEMTGIPYAEICIAAFLPAVLYFTACYFFVDFEAARTGMKGMKKEDLPDLKKIIVKGGYVFIVMGVLIYLLIVTMASPMKAAFWSSVVLLGLSIIWISADQRITWKTFFVALEKGARGMLLVSAACATAGVIVAVISLTGVGLAISSLLVGMGENSLMLTLILTMLVSIVMGMGLPPTAAYIILAVLTAPALVKLGLPVIVAHLFVFYYTCFSPITPPVALAAYTGAGIAGSNPMQTGFTAWRIGLVAFLIPMFMVFNQSLLLMGVWWQIGVTVVTGFLGVCALAAAVTGWFLNYLNMLQRMVSLTAAVLLIWPNIFGSLFGIALFCVVGMSSRVMKARAI